MKAGVVHSRHSAGVWMDRWADIQMDGWKEKKARMSLRDFHLKRSFIAVVMVIFKQVGLLAPL